jgi:hypothetical protein
MNLQTRKSKQLQQQVAQLTGFIQNQQTQQQSYEQASTQSFIDQFAAETDASGNPAHPHFEHSAICHGVTH